MKEIVSQYAAYNLWANNIFINFIKGLPAGQLLTTTQASFPSIMQTLQHMWETETAWWKRVQLEENIPAPGQFEQLAADKLMTSLLKQSETIKQWIDQARQEKIVHVIAYRNSKKVEYKQPVYQIFLHLFNHQTYHRGQLVCMFHQLGVTNIPNSDFINFSRSSK